VQENEEMEDEDFMQNVKHLYKMRNDIVHDGKNLEDIKADPSFANIYDLNIINNESEC
jgi:uncharacterized protein YutE (UPF0331/DUF86 family)